MAVVQHTRVLRTMSAGECLPFFFLSCSTKIPLIMLPFLPTTLSIFSEKFMKSLSSMVSQIGHISSDIKSQIDKLESFSMFEMKVDPAKEKRSAAAAEIVLKTPSQPKEPQPHHHHHHHHHHRHSSSHQQKITADGPSAAAGAAAAQAEDNSAGEQSQQQQKPPAKKPKRVSIREAPPDDGVRPCQDYFQALELERNEKTTKLAKLYDSIGPILIKLESLVLGTFTGKCPQMKYYYSYWEKQVFACFTRYGREFS